jgi:hypothetical protein
VSALRGHHFLVITLVAFAPPGTHTALVKAAVEAGIPYIMPNCYGADITREDLRNADSHAGTAYKNAAEIQEMGASYVAMCCGFWYEWSLATGEQWYGFDIKERKVTFYDEGKTKIHTSTWTQCGRALAALLSLPVEKSSTDGPALEDWKNKPLCVSSFFASQRDMLDSLHRVLGTKDEDWKIQFETCEKRVQDGAKEQEEGDWKGMAKKMYATYFKPGAMDFGDKLANGVLGLQEEALDEATKRAVDMVESGWSPFHGP